MNEFQLLELPWLGIGAVLLNFDLPELINFSFISKRCQRFVKALKPPTTGVISTTNKSVCISIRFYSWTNMKGKWIFNDKEYEERGIKMPVSFAIGECDFRNFVENHNLYSYGDSRQCVNSAIKYLEGLFNRLMFHVKYYTDDIPISSYPISVECQKCKELYIRGDNLMDNEEELNRMIEQRTAEYIGLYVPTSSEFKSDLGSWGNPECITIWEDSLWVTNEMLFKSKSNTLILNNCKLTSNDCRFFVKRWFDSDDIHFKFLQLTWYFDGAPEDLNFENLGFELSTFDKNVRSNEFVFKPGEGVNCATGLDFLRKDGLLATVMIERGGLNDEFVIPFIVTFCVWHNRFPDMNGVKVLL